MSLSYVIVSPCRDEAEYLAITVRSVLAQSRLPTRWVIVDDGSTDSTPGLLAELSSEHPWITVLTLADRGFRQLGGGVVLAFNCGLEVLGDQEYDLVVKLDLDVDLPSTYFAEIVSRLETQPRLGSASGKPFFTDARGEVVWEDCSFENSVGMVKTYRRTALADIDGLVPELMWDGLDCSKMRHRGWVSRCFDDEAVAFEHLRAMGTSDRGILRGRRRHGRGQWYMGTSSSYLLASALRRLRERPTVLGSINMIAGYAWAALTRLPRHADDALRADLRRFQRDALVLGKRRAVERWEGRSAVKRSAHRIAYLVSEYPALSHAFIRREIRGLEAEGLGVKRFSARVPSTSLSTDDEVEARATVALQGSPALAALAVLSCSLRSPDDVAKALMSTLRTGVERASIADRVRRLAYLAQAAVLVRHLQQTGIAHVHVHFANNAAEIARLAGVLSGGRVTYSLTIHSLAMHGLDGLPGEELRWPDANEERWGRLVDKLYGASHVVCINDFGARQIVRLDGSLSDRLRVIRVGVDTDFFSPPTHAASEAGLRIAFVGRLAPEKQPALVVRAMGELISEGIVASCVVAGSGPLQSELEAQISSSGLAARVSLVGGLSQADVRDLYRSVDVVVLPSLVEGIPTVLMEAMSCGVPVVASRLPGTIELVSEHEGRLVDATSQEELVAAVRSLVDPAVRRALGAAGRAKVIEQHSIHDQVDAMASVLAAS